MPFLNSKVSALSGLQFGLKVVEKAAIYFFPFKSEAAVCVICVLTAVKTILWLCATLCVLNIVTGCRLFLVYLMRENKKKNISKCRY